MNESRTLKILSQQLDFQAEKILMAGSLYFTPACVYFILLITKFLCVGFFFLELANKPNETFSAGLSRLVVPDFCVHKLIKFSSKQHHAQVSGKRVIVFGTCPN